MSDIFLTPDQVSKQLQINRETVMRWLRSGKLPGVKAGKLWRVNNKELNIFLNGQAAR